MPRPGASGARPNGPAARRKPNLTAGFRAFAPCAYWEPRVAQLGDRCMWLLSACHLRSSEGPPSGVGVTFVAAGGMVDFGGLTPPASGAAGSENLIFAIPAGSAGLTLALTACARALTGGSLKRRSATARNGAHHDEDHTGEVATVKVHCAGVRLHQKVSLSFCLGSPRKPAQRWCQDPCRISRAPVKPRATRSLLPRKHQLPRPEPHRRSSRRRCARRAAAPTGRS